MNEPKVKGRRYDWEGWFRYKKFKLENGKDYNGLDHTFATYVRRAAKRYGYLVEVRVQKGYLVVSVNGRTIPDLSIHNKSNKYRKDKR